MKMLAKMNKNERYGFPLRALRFSRFSVHNLFLKPTHYIIIKETAALG